MSKKLNEHVLSGEIIDLDLRSRGFRAYECLAA